jgi:hypothetical protein
MSYVCSDETQVVEYAENADKIRMVCDLMNGSKYKTIAQEFLNQKNIDLECRYSYSVSDVSGQNAAYFVFFATDKVKNGYFIKVDRSSESVSEWYINEDIANLVDLGTWFALDVVTDEKVEYYVFESSDGSSVEKKYNSLTNQQIVTNHFGVFSDMTAEQQDLIKDLPFKRTTVCWANKPNGFVVEFLPSYVDVYRGINMSNLHLLNI